MEYCVYSFDWDTVRTALDDATLDDLDPEEVFQDECASVMGDSMTFMDHVGGSFDNFREHLDAPVADAIESFLARICPGMRSGSGFVQVMDIPLDEDEETVITMSPDSVREQAARFDAVDLSGIEQAYTKGDPDSYLIEPDETDASEWVEYVQAWGALFRKTAEAGRAIRITAG